MCSLKLLRSLHTEFEATICKYCNGAIENTFAHFVTGISAKIDLALFLGDINLMTLWPVLLIKSILYAFDNFIVFETTIQKEKNILMFNFY